MPNPSQPLRHRDVYPTEGYHYGTSVPGYHRQRAEQKKNGERVTGPFGDQDESEFVRWLDKHAISQGARQEFFELNNVRLINARVC